MADLSYFKKFKRGIDFMDGRERKELSDLCTGEEFHIEQFDFLPGDNSDYAVFTVEELPGYFFFGNSVVTDVLQQIKDDEMTEDLPNVNVVFEKRTSQKNRDYIALSFVL